MGESAEKQERVAEELDMEVDVKEDDYCCAWKDRLGENSLFEWWRWRTQEVMNAIASKTGWSSGGEKDASKILRSRSSAENPKESCLVRCVV